MQQQAPDAMSRLVNIRNLPRNEILVLGMLALLVILAILFPWSRLWPEKSTDLDGKYPFASIREMKPKLAPGPAVWRMNVTYRPQRGRLTVRLENKYDASTRGFSLVARFSPDSNQPPVLGAWLEEQANGNYSSDAVRLKRGQWFMSVTGRRQSKPVFLLEQTLRVP